MPPSFLSGRGRMYLIALCSLLSVAAGAAAGVLPAPWSWAIAATALVLGGLAGLASKVPTFLVGRPLVSPAVAAACVAVAGVLFDQATVAPDGLGKSLLLAGAVVFAGLAGKPLPMPGSAAQSALKVLALVVLTSMVGCSTGPRRAGLVEAAQGPSLQEEPKASPFSVGPMLAVVVPFNGEPARPAELVVGTVRLNGGEGRAVNALAFGGFAGKSFGDPASGGVAGGLGASVELTPGTLLYSVDLGAGLVFGEGFGGPAAALGFTVQTKF